MAYGHPFPRTYGMSQGMSPWEQELAALLSAYGPAWSQDTGSQNYAECVALSLAAANVWCISQRAANMMLPMKMYDLLPVYEEAMGLVPQPTDTVQQRRAAVAARFLGWAGNSLANIEQVASTMLGTAFVGVAVAPPGTSTSYRPLLAPGPPGCTYSSTLAKIVVKVAPEIVPDATMLDLMRRLRVELNNLCASYAVVIVGAESGGFTYGQGYFGLTLF